MAKGSIEFVALVQDFGNPYVCSCRAQDHRQAGLRGEFQTFLKRPKRRAQMSASELHLSEEARGAQGQTRLARCSTFGVNLCKGTLRRDEVPTCPLRQRKVPPN
jgi:hypothetical protein